MYNVWTMTSTMCGQCQVQCVDTVMYNVWTMSSTMCGQLQVQSVDYAKCNM